MLFSVDARPARQYARVVFVIAVQQILAKKLRTLLTMVGFGVCVNLYIVVTTVMRFVTEDLDLQVQRFAGLLLVQSRSETGMTGIEWPPISSALPLADARAILDSPRIDPDVSSPVTFAALAPPPFPTAPPEALLVGIDAGKEAAFLGTAPALLGRNRLDAHTPDSHNPDAHNPDADPPINPVILGVLSARHFAATATATTEIPSPVGPIGLAAIGSRIDVRGHQFEVVGIIEPEINQLLRSCVVVPLAAAQEIVRQPDAVSAVFLSPRKTSDVHPLQEEIESGYPALMVINDEALAENASRLLERVTQLFNVVRWTAVVVAALLIAIVMFVTVLERTREIGTLRAIGAPARSIFFMIVAESMLISSAGAAAGVPMSRFVIRKALGPDAAGIRSSRIEATAALLLTTFGLTASLLPALRAVRVDPIVALRYE